jgi:hypothetical protein
VEDSRVLARFEDRPEEERGQALAEGALLAAALAAALVEYQRYVARRNGREGAAAGSERWRTMGCWERLQGRG